MKIARSQFLILIQTLAQIVCFIQLVIHLDLVAMSSKLQVKALLAKSHSTTQHSIIAHYKQDYSSYDYELETNLLTILRLYQNLDKSKIRNLLEELDNNLELAIKILEEEIQASNHIREEKKAEPKKVLSLTPDEENQILKQSYLNLYKKFASFKQQNEELAKINENYTFEIERLKYMNKVLLQGEYNQRLIEQGTDIY